MRIIGGKYRSRTLLAPKGMETRPTLDQVREALFNILQGSDSPVDVSGGKIGGHTVYVLGIVGGELGFYPLDSSQSQIPARKAYYLAD